MRTLALLVLGWTIVLGACGEDPAPSNSFYEAPGAGGSAGSGAGYCVTYCNYVTANGTGCATYNDGARCTKNCSTYATGPCPNEWLKYVNCVEKTSISCAMTDAGKLGLDTLGCGTEFNEFLTCLEANDGGLCP